MKAKSEETKQKLRGGYYTPRPVARYLAEWVLAGGAERVLEPSCGDGRIVEALVEAHTRNGGLGKLAVDAVELFEEEAEKTQQRVAGQEAVDVTVRSRDFFGWITNGARHQRWDAVVGNPPYIRYQYFDEEQRDRAARVVERADLTFSKRTNAWMPFVMAAVQHLRPGGRLAMVVPSEILHIQHAQGLRLFLEQEMQNLALVSFRELIFDGALQGTLLLLGERRAGRTRGAHQRSLFAQFFPEEAGDGSRASTNAEKTAPSEDVGDTRFAFIDIGGIEDLPAPEALSKRRANGHARSFDGEWMKAFLSPEELQLVERLERREGVYRFDEVADVKIGIVTGANKFFVVNEATLEKYDLEQIAAPMLARTQHAGGLEYTKEDHRANSKKGRRVHFLHFPERPMSELPERWQAYLREGEQQKLHERYKCRIREPWYRVPYVWAGTLAMPKRCHRHHRMIYNEAGAFSTDTLYRMKLHPAFAKRGHDLAFSFLNSLTLLQAEIHGRHYGGGVLELVPSEINRLHIPLVRVKEAAFEKADEMVRAGADQQELIGFTNEVVLEKGLGLAAEDVRVLREAHARYVRRRLREEG